MERGERGPDKAEIEASSDAAMLTMWYRDAVETIESIRATIEGFRLAGCAEDAWLKRVGSKIGYLKQLARWAELRLITLGHPVPYLPLDPRRIELRRQLKVIERLHAALRAAGVPIPGDDGDAA